jgi:hypothetical protein
MLNKLTPTDPTIEATIQRIETFGGGFAKQLMAAYRTADMRNRQRIIDAFEELFDEYGPNGIFGPKDESVHSWIRSSAYDMLAPLSIRKQTN